MDYLIVGAVVIILLLLIFIKSYKKTGPNEVLIITGAHLRGPYVQENKDTSTRVKVVKGGGAFIIPVLQQCEVQSLDTFPINVMVKDVMTVDSVPVNAQASAVLRVGSDPALIAIAAEKMLGLSEEERNQQMTEVVKGALREALSQMTPKEANDRSTFQETVVEACAPTFQNLGLEITTLKITEISDNNGYYESLSAKEIAVKQADARKARADANKEATLVEAENQKQAKIAELEASRSIAEKQKEIDVAKANYDTEVKQNQAVAEKAYDISTAEQEAIVEEKKIIVNQNQFKATIIAEQEAKKQSQQMSADAQAYAAQKQADAQAYTAQKKADADAYTFKTAGQAEADKIVKIGKATADSQKASADALKENGDMALKTKIIDILPELVAQSAQAVSSIDNLTVLNGAQGMEEQSSVALNNALAVIKTTTGIDISELVKKRADGTTTIAGKVPVESDHNKK